MKKAIKIQDMLAIEQSKKNNLRLTEVGMWDAVCYHSYEKRLKAIPQGGGLDYWSDAWKDLQKAYPSLPAAHVEALVKAFKQLFAAYVAGKDNMSWADLMFRTGWYACGMQSFQMSHTLAAQFMATTVSPDCFDLLEMPWPSFAIRLPTDMVYLSHRDNTPCLMTDLLVTTTEYSNTPLVSLTLFGEGTAVFRATRPSLAELLLPVKYDEKQIQEQYTRGLEFWSELSVKSKEADFRVYAAMQNLVASLLAHLTDRSLSVDPTKSTVEEPFAKDIKRLKTPGRREHKLRMPISLDVKDHVRAYLRGEGKPPKAQTLVMGHYKMQPHGPQNTLRKLIYRKPFWRGPKDGPVAIRPHIVPDPKKGKPGDGET